MNRVSAYEANFQNQLMKNPVSEKTLQSASKTLDLDASLHARLQEQKSLYFVEGKLTKDEADRIYQVLGNSVTYFNNQPVTAKLAVISVLTSVGKDKE